MSTGKVGAIAELAVCADLMRRGFEVYRAVSQASDFDLVAIANGRVFTVEVTSSTAWKVNGDPSLHHRHHVKKQKADLYAVVNHRKDIIKYYPNNIELSPDIA